MMKILKEYVKIIKIFSFSYSYSIILSFAAMYSEILTAAVHKKEINEMKDML